MKYRVDLEQGRKLAVEADYFEIDDSGALVLRSSKPIRKVAVVAANAWVCIYEDEVPA